VICLSRLALYLQISITSSWTGICQGYPLAARMHRAFALRGHTTHTIDCDKIVLTQLEQRRCFTKRHDFSGTVHPVGGFGVPDGL
jgi:hypothetical protein